MSYGDQLDTIGQPSSSSPSIDPTGFEHYPQEYPPIIENRWTKQDVTVHLVPQQINYPQEQTIQPTSLTSIGMTQDIMELFHRTFPSGQSRYMGGRNRFTKLQELILITHCI